LKFKFSKDIQFVQAILLAARIVLRFQRLPSKFQHFIVLESAWLSGVRQLSTCEPSGWRKGKKPKSGKAENAV